jgi:hypothetical protein
MNSQSNPRREPNFARLASEQDLQGIGEQRPHPYPVLSYLPIARDPAHRHPLRQLAARTSSDRFSCKGIPYALRCWH